jgi:hypothetical protein
VFFFTTHQSMSPAITGALFQMCLAELGNHTLSQSASVTRRSARVSCKLLDTRTGERRDMDLRSRVDASNLFHSIAFASSSRSAPSLSGLLAQGCHIAPPRIGPLRWASHQGPFQVSREPPETVELARTRINTGVRRQSHLPHRQVFLRHLFSMSY